MPESITQTLEPSLAAAKESVTAAAAALDEAILNDPELSHKQRIVLIHLQTAARRHQLILDHMAICIELVDKRVDNVIKFAH